MNASSWTRAEKLAACGIVVAVVLAILALLSPEVRALLGLDGLHASNAPSPTPITLFDRFRRTGSHGLAFASRLDLQTEGQPLGVAAADFDGDGKVDLVATIYSGNNGNTVAVFRNLSSIGAPAFSPPIEVPVGISPEGVAAADLDADGRPDLVIANAGNDTISLLRNISTPQNIAFERLPDLHIPTPHRIAIADLDRDGMPDLVVSSNSGKEIAVYHHATPSGTIAFDSRTDLSTSEYVNAFTIADVDSDGNRDILVPLTDSHSLAVFRNSSTRGSVEFTLAYMLNTGALPDSVATLPHGAGFNPDVIVGSRGVAGITVFHFDGRKLSLAATAETGASPSAITAGDLDGDGRLDLVVANSSSSTLTLLRNTSSGDEVQLSPQSPELRTGAYPADLLLEDIDGDSRLDIVTTNHQGKTISIFMNISG